MASSRQMRRPGPSTLKAPPSDRNKISSADEASPSPQSLDWTEWEEPPLRQPVPSFEDYRGLERHGVLEHMAPLGSLPNAKVKARIRQYDPSRRTTHLRQGDTRPVGAEGSTPEPNFGPRRSVYQQDVPSSNLSSIRHQSEFQSGDAQVTPSIFIAQDVPLVPMHNRSAVPVSAPPLPLPPTSTNTSHYKRIVDWAVHRAEESSNRALGIAIQKLYEESLYDAGYADLLTAVLNQSVTPQQFEHFGNYLKAARRIARREEKRRHPSAPKTSKSQSALDTARHLHVPTETLDTNNLDPAMLEASKSLQPRLPSSAILTNGSPTKKTTPLKRTQITRSTSSDSPLSDLEVDIEDLAPDKVDYTGSRGLVSAGVLDPFSADHYSLEQDSAEDSPAKRLAAKRRLDRELARFRDASNVQSPLSSLRKSNLPPTALQDRAQQPRRQGLGPKRTPQRQERESSDSSLSSFADVPPPPSLTTRGITPQLGRPPKGGKGAARIKQSPLKKRNGVTAGLAQHVDVEPTHASNGRVDEHPSEPEICSACSGNGSLVLCDGCPRGYHFTCCDPPLHPETRKDELPEQWFCRRCSSHTAKADKDSSKTPGLWRELSMAMRSRNPTAFSLPQQMREHFEGVVVGEEGEYEDAHNVKISKARAGYDEIPDNFKFKDRRDHAILCFRCGSSANGKREIVPCDYCGLGWHLDCLDPPLASAPNKKAPNGKPRQTWMCPNHADHELINMTDVASMDGKRTIKKPASAQPQEYRRVFHTRRARQPSIVNIGLRRGFRNRGLIEVEEDDSDEESEIERELSGVIYKVPERGIKLDFIDRIKVARFEHQAYEARSIAKPNRPGENPDLPAAELNGILPSPAADDFDKRPFRERKAALNLAQLAQDNVGLSSDQVVNLIHTLTAEAPTTVEHMLSDAEHKMELTKGSVPAVDGQERRDLEMLISLARQRLGCVSA